VGPMGAHGREDSEPLTVLLVDDEPDVLDMLELSISSMGYRVTSAGSGEEALAKAKQGLFDLAVVDLRMPGLDGLATTRALKDLDPSLAVVIATAYVSAETRASCLQSGATDLISKPFTLDALEALLQRVISR
jgi:two-component system, NtrC family, response regulator HydG